MDGPYIWTITISFTFQTYTFLSVLLPYVNTTVKVKKINISFHLIFKHTRKECFGFDIKIAKYGFSVLVNLNTPGTL